MVGKKLGKDDLDKILNGDNNLANQLYGEIVAYLAWQKKIYKFTNETLEDIAQITLLSLLNNAKKGKFRYESSLNTYAIAIAKKQVLKFFVNKEPVMRIEDTDLMDKLIQEEPDNYYLNEVKKNVFNEELKKLGKECRKLLRLAAKKIDYKTISKKLGYSSDKYVKTKIYRCKETFVKQIENNLTYQKYKDYDNQDFEILEPRNE